MVAPLSAPGDDAKAVAGYDDNNEIQGKELI
jgi:hypothetical protein